MIITSGKAVIVQLYAPSTCNKTSINELSKIAGGCTILQGRGEWLDIAGTWVLEDVVKYEWVFTRPVHSPEFLAQSLCKKFLLDNPHEREALCTVQTGTGITYVRVQQEVNSG